MKDKKISLLSIFMLLPIMTFAHGEEVIFTFLGVVVETIIFLIIIPVIKIKALWKSIMILVYFISILLAFIFTNHIAYIENESEVNIILIVMPIAIVILTYILLKLFEKREKS